MNKTLWIAAIVWLALPGYSIATTAHDTGPFLAQATDLAGTLMFLESHAPGMILVAIRGDDQIVLGFGETALGNKQKPTGDSLFRLNSITKVFATETLASLMTDGKLRLTDPLQRFAGDVKVPQFEGHAITLLDLATHSAAMPREIDVTPPPGSGARNWPTRADRWKWISTYTLPWAPGTIAAYSNPGFDFLADAIETADEKPYPEVLKARVTGPLGMNDTTFTPTPEQCKRLMAGSGLGASKTCEDTHATGGSGGLYSTGNDMVRWLRHHLERNETLALSHAVYRQRQDIPVSIGFDEGAPMSGLGLGWVYLASSGTQSSLLTKSGGGVGFMSYAVLAPGRDTAVLAVVNRTDFPIFAPLVGAVNTLMGSLITR